jgi:tetraprenyl-beta-curcumene synthase
MGSVSHQSVTVGRPGRRSAPGAITHGRADGDGTGARTDASLARATARELIWGLRQVSREVEHWRRRAGRIPDLELRADALDALTRKRGNINGAALFWTLPDRRNRDLLSVLVAYEILADYLDCVNERGADLGVGNGRQLHLALVEAFDPGAGISDYYRYHQSREDGGYARALVESCRAGCERLPSYERVRPFLARAAGLSGVLAINHEPDAEVRDRALQDWAGLEWPTSQSVGSKLTASGELSWFERAAGASAWLTVLAMLALAADPGHPTRPQREPNDTYCAYLSWISTTGAMLDSYSDIAQDVASGDHSYIAHYPKIEVAVDRLSELIRRSRSEARALPRGPRHSVLTACMIAFYLSKDSVRTPAMRAKTRQLRRAGGPIVGLLVPVLRLWRTAYRQRSA